MNRRILVAFLLTFLFVGIVSCANDQDIIENKNESESLMSYPENPNAAVESLAEGHLYKHGSIDVLVLNGTYKQMGQQYGALLKQELNENYEGIVEGLRNIEELSLDDLKEFGASVYDKYPQKYKEIINGLAEASGLGLEKAQVLNVQEIYVFDALFSYYSSSQSDRCSGIAAWDSYTEDGSLIFGRNYDLGFFNTQYVAMVIYNPVDGSIPTASFTYAGCIYTTSGMNSKGLFLELNNGSFSDPEDFTAMRMWAPINLMSFLEQASNLEQLAYFFESVRPDLAYIVQGADMHSALSFEWATYGVRAVEPEREGLLVATNHFADPEWGLPAIDENTVETCSLQRRKNLLTQGEENKGMINPDVMMKIMSIPLAEGGAFQVPNLTSYGIVAQPAELKIWVQIPDYQDWVEIDLGKYFKQ